MGEEEVLWGGNMGPVRRSGDSVLRVAGPRTPAVHRLLAHCRSQGFTQAPEPRGHTPDGKDVVSFLPGDVPQYPMPAWVWSNDALVSSAQLLRDFHTASSSCDRTGPWRSPSRWPAEVVCHNDFAPYNLVFSDGLAIGVIDFDYASPGPRLWDFAYLAYRIVPVSIDRPDGFTDQERRDRLERLVLAYGAMFRIEDVLRAMTARLHDLTAFSDSMAVQLDQPQLTEHARSYQADARYIEGVCLPAGW